MNFGWFLYDVGIDNIDLNFVVDYFVGFKLKNYLYGRINGCRIILKFIFIYIFDGYVFFFFCIKGFVVNNGNYIF